MGDDSPGAPQAGRPPTAPDSKPEALLQRLDGQHFIRTHSEVEKTQTYCPKRLFFFHANYTPMEATALTVTFSMFW